MKNAEDYRKVSLEYALGNAPARGPSKTKNKKRHMAKRSRAGRDEYFVKWFAWSLQQDLKSH